MNGGKKADSSARFNPRVYALVTCGIAVLLLALSVLPWPAFPGPAPSQTFAPLRAIPDTDLNPFGGNFFLDWEVEPWKVDKTLQMAQEAGLGWANVHFVWEGLELKKGHFWDDRLGKSTWDKYDYIVQAAQKRGLRVIARVDRPPDWTRADNSLRSRPPDRFEDYGDFVAAVAERYKGRVDHFQIWNEPNIYPEWGNQPVDPVAYAGLLKIAHQRIKKANPSAKILSAPLAQNAERGPRNLNELDFLETMYQAGAKDYFDILSANGYGFDSPPEEAPDFNKLNFARVVLLRQVMERYGDSQKAVWFHEFGWNASPETMAKEKLLWRRVSEQEQADYTTRAIRRARAEWPWAGVFSIWYFRQDGHITPDQSEYYFRMVDPGFTPRLIYYAIANEAKGVGIAGPGVYQESNPALVADVSWREERDAARGITELVTDQPGASLTIRFWGTDFALVATKEIAGARLLVTVDGTSARLLASGGEGRSFLDLYSPNRSPGTIIPVASGLPYGEHVVRFVTAAGPNQGAALRAAVDGFHVSAVRQTPWLASGLIVLAVLAVVFVFAAFARRRTGRGRGA